MANIDNVRIKVNTFNRLKKIREGIVYESITTVIDELLQNCQRSFSLAEIENPVIDIVLNQGILIIRDNGTGCDDPQSIFEFETSGWDISDAFGQGGSESVFQIADSISIRSRDWRATVNVLDVLETGNLDVVTEQVETIDGYELLIQGEKIQMNSEMLSKHIKNSCCYFSCDCFLNGKIIEKLNLHEINSPFTKMYDNDYYQASLGVQKGYRDCSIFYEKRKVCLQWLPGVIGIIELKRGAVNLKAPDRKSIIYDSKKAAFQKQLELDAKDLYSSFIRQSSSDEFMDYEYGIDHNLTPAVYADYLPTYETLREAEIHSEVPSSGTVMFMKELDRKQTDGGVETSGHVVNSSITMKNYTPRVGDFKKSLGKLLNTVWCAEHEKDELQEFINKAESYGLKVVYSHGKLYEKAFNYWGVPHISEVMEKTESRFIVGSVSGYSKQTYRGISRKEERLMKVLNAIETYYGLEDVFKIADVKEHKYLEYEGETVIDTIVKKDFAPMKDRKKIYLNRDSLNLGKINVSSTAASITKFDILVILLNIQTIANGLAQILYNTVENTVDHYTKVERISKEIALLLASL